MNRSMGSRVVAGAAAVGLGVMLVWGGMWFADSHAAPAGFQQAQAPMESTAPAADSGASLPATGFAPIAKSVTPAVVNITVSSRGERISGKKDQRQEWKDRMEEFGWPFGGPLGIQVLTREARDNLPRSITICLPRRGRQRRHAAGGVH